MVFHWRLSDNKSPQVSRTLLSILAVFNNVVVWMVSTRPRTSKSSRPFNNPLVTVPKAPITFGIIVTFMFHSFLFFFLLISLFTFFQFYSVVSRDSKVDNFADFLFFCGWLLLGLVIWSGLGDPFVYQSLIGGWSVILLIWEFFPPASADSFLRESEWWQVSSSVRDSSLF